jgi:CBS domain-containing protein
MEPISPYPVKAQPAFQTGGIAMKVSNVMTKNIRLVSPDQTLRDAARMMSEEDVGALPVADNDRLVGMVTDRDIAIRGVGEGMAAEAKVRQVMTEQVKYCFEDEDLAHVSQNMASLQMRRLPVMNRDKRLVGIVSLGDLAVASKAKSQAAQALHGISQPGD